MEPFEPVEILLILLSPPLVALVILGSIWFALHKWEDRDTKRFVERSTRQLQAAESNRLPGELNDYAIQRTEEVPIVAYVVLDTVTSGARQDDSSYIRLIDRWRKAGLIVRRNAGFESEYKSSVDGRNHCLGIFENLDEAAQAVAEAHRKSVDRRRNMKSQIDSLA